MFEYTDLHLVGIGRNPSRWRVSINNREIATVTENDLSKEVPYLLLFKGHPNAIACRSFNEVVERLLAHVNN